MEECVNDELGYENRNNVIEENETKLNNEYEYDAEVNEEEGYEKQLLKVKPVKKLMIHKKAKKMSLLKKIDGISASEKMNAKIGGDDVPSVEEEENIYHIFENGDDILTKDSIVWVNSNKKIWKGSVGIVAKQEVKMVLWSARISGHIKVRTILLYWRK